MTNWTIGLVLAALAIVLVVKRLVNAHATGVAVLKVLGTSHTAKSTFGTMIGLIFIGHPKIANGTMVLAKLDAALDAFVAVLFIFVIRR